MNDFQSWDAGLHRPIDPNSLQHFGTKGMKWGQRRFQNPDGSLTALGQKRYGKDGERSAHGRSRDLNKLDRERVNAEYQSQKYRDKAEARFSRQQYRAKKKDPKARIQKDEKTRKLEDKANKYAKVAAGGKKMIDRIINDTKSKKMSVRSKDTLRTVDFGKDYAKSLGVNMLLGGRGFYTQSHQAVGTKYKVKKDGKGQQIHKKNYRTRRNAGKSSAMVFV